jgi:hypothetical protein
VVLHSHGRNSLDDVSVLPVVTVTAVTTLSNDAIITRERGESQRGRKRERQLLQTTTPGKIQITQDYTF